MAVEIVLALCLVLAVLVETVEYARLGVGVGGGGKGFVGALFRGVDGGGVMEVYLGDCVCCSRRDGLGVVNVFLGGGGVSKM